MSACAIPQSIEARFGTGRAEVADLALDHGVRRRGRARRPGGLLGAALPDPPRRLIVGSQPCVHVVQTDQAQADLHRSWEHLSRIAPS
ncbi:hypothetical protein A7J05_01205 [Streptomyces alfalfae]|uniref:Uncharacterized protein n=1 Tax=Streptomyces alfalfae TaxID=1642299 RepID=A0ABN4VBS0_9ACTN|nr:MULTISPECIES: hypothetical protein [Streptomyces]APY84568.1 hypothetical protein A7J05_01205 [Streptomyces alfalfae]